MLYEYSLIHISDSFENGGDMYRISLADAHEMNFSLNGSSVMLSGKYLFCFSSTDTVKNVTGDYSVKTLSFLPYFYNINLNTAIIDAPVYEEMREKYGYPDFHLFRNRSERYIGIIKLTDGEYETIISQFFSAERHINDHLTDGMWSCRTRSDMISILRIAEAAHIGKHTDVTNEVLRYIRANPQADLSLSALCKKFNTNRTTLATIIKELTGLTPSQYVLSERLGQSRPELLFTSVPLEDIAEKYGFADMNYYIRAFKKKYGVTPFQYRKNGVEKRKREAKNYSLKNGGKELMTTEEFGEYIHKGLGIAVIRLRREPDKMRFRETFLNYIINDSKWYSEKYHCFEYENELLSCFNDAEVLKEEIISYLISSGSVLSPYLVGLMKHWCSSEQLMRIEETLGTVYENCYRRVFDAADAITDKSLYKLFDQPTLNEEKIKAGEQNPEICALNELYREYHTAFDALTLFYDSVEGIKHLVDREMEMRERTGYVPSAPAYDVLFERFHDANPEIANYISHRFSADYLQKYRIFKIKYLRPSEIEKLDADYFINKKYPGRADSRAFVSEYLPVSVGKKVRDTLFSTQDREERIRLMSLFFSGPDHWTEPVRPTVQFLPELKAAIEADPTSEDSHVLSAFVLGFRNKMIKEYASELIREGKLVHHAIASYFLINYEKEDRELFAKRLSEISGVPGIIYGLYCWCFTKCIEKGMSDLPLEMAHFVFRSYPVNSARRLFVRALYIGGVNDPLIIEEALHDADSEIRKYAALMRDNIPYIDIKKLNAITAGDCVRFFEERERNGHQWGTGLDRHLSQKEYEDSIHLPLQTDSFYDGFALSYAARVKLIADKKIDGFIAYIDKNPVGFIDCGTREKFTYLNKIAGEAEKDEFAITEPVTFGDLTGDMRVAEALIERVVRYVTEDERPTVKVYLQENRNYYKQYDKFIALFIKNGFEIQKQDEGNVVLVLKNIYTL